VADSRVPVRQQVDNDPERLSAGARFSMHGDGLPVACSVSARVVRDARTGDEDISDLVHVSRLAEPRVISPRQSYYHKTL